MFGIMVYEHNGWTDYGPLISRPNQIHSCAHYFCPECGTEWATMYPLDSNTHRHQVYHTYCPEHGGGSLNLWGTYPLQFLPAQLLAREIELILSYGDHYDFCNYTDNRDRRLEARRRKLEGSQTRE